MTPHGTTTIHYRTNCGAGRHVGGWATLGATASDWPVSPMRRVIPEQARSQNVRKPWWGRLLGIVGPLLVLVLSVAVPPAASAQTDVLSVEEFVARQDQWESLVGKRLHIEGRYSSLSRTLLRFRGCPLTFRSENELPALPESVTTVEVTGYLVKEKNRLEFLVERLTARNNDADRFLTMMAAIRSDEPPDAWYRLAEWARRRSRFYDDPELARLARRAVVAGLESERLRLHDPQPGQLWALAAKARSLDAPRPLILERLHEAAVREWQTLRRGKSEPGRFQHLADRLAEQLIVRFLYPADCLQPLADEPTELRDAYLKDPLNIYEHSRQDDQQRRTLHRILYAEVVVDAIRADAARNGSNGFQIADRIAKALPDWKSTARGFREREATARAARLEELTRAEVRELADQFRLLEQPDMAGDVLRRWLAMREKQLRQDGPIGLMQSAEEYVDLLDDRETAARLLKQAYRENPKLEGLAAALKRLGYQLQQGEWVRADKDDPLPLDPIRRAIREGRVQVGMTSEQVLKAQGRPTQIVRVGTLGRITEIWLYGEPDRTRLVIRIERSRNRPLGTVSEISTAPPRRQ